MTPKEAFLYYFKRMDLDNLEIVLTDDIFYCGLTKQTFMEKLDELFVFYKSLGLYEVQIQQSIENSCCYDFFIRPNSWGKYENKLLIVDNDGKIKGFQIIETDRPYGNRLWVYPEDLIGFKMDMDLILLQNRFRLAIEDAKNNPITTQKILDFVEEYKDIYEKYEDDIMMRRHKYFFEFINLYCRFTYLQECLDFYPIAKMAIECFHTRNSDKEWLDKFGYEARGYDNILPSWVFIKYISKADHHFKEGGNTIISKEIHVVYQYIILLYRTFSRKPDSMEPELLDNEDEDEYDDDW